MQTKVFPLQENSPHWLKGGMWVAFTFYIMTTFYL